MSNYLTGFSGALVASVGFGSNFVPVKKYEMGDGMFFQFILSTGIWTLGLIYQIIRSLALNKGPFFHPLAILGGCIWSLGNLCTVPIIKCIGMALGLAIWGGTTLITGWATGKWGLLGTPKDSSVKIEWLNYLGVLCSVIAIVLFSTIQPIQKKDEILNKEHSQQLINNNLLIDLNNKQNNEKEQIINNKKMKQIQKSFVDNLSIKHKQIIGVLLSLFAGLCYGTSFCPIQYVINTHKNQRGKNGLYPKHLEDYTFCHFTGILLTSQIFFVFYCLYTKNNIQLINTKAVFPSILSGFVWALAQIGFFIADSELGTETSFPIVASAPQIIGTLWGVFVFKEIKGKTNIIKLISAIFVAFIGIIFIAISNL